MGKKKRLKASGNSTHLLRLGQIAREALAGIRKVLAQHQEELKAIAGRKSKARRRSSDYEYD